MILPPLFWAALAIASVPVLAAYFYRRRSRVVVVPAVDEWARFGRPLDTRSIAALLRSLASLALQLLLVALVWLAWTGALRDKPQTRKLALVIDAGATMQTREAGTTRFAQARELASRRLQLMPRNSEIYLITAAHRPLVAHASAVDAVQAHEDLKQARVLDVESDLAAAVRAAAAYVGDDPMAEVLVGSDLTAERPSSNRRMWETTAKSRLSLASVGSDHAASAAITNLWCERVAGGCRVAAMVLSRGMADRSVEVRMESGGKMLWKGTAQLKDAPVSVKPDALLAPRTPFEIHIESGDDLDVDDRAYGVTPPARPAIRLVTVGNAALEQALRADSSATVHVVTPDAYQPAKSDEVLVVDSVELPRVPERAGCLFIAATDPRGRLRLGPAAAVDPITHWLDHPALVDVQPDLIRISAAKRVQSHSGTLSALVTANQTPLIVEVRPQEVQGTAKPSLYWLFRLQDSDLASRPTFPVLLWNALDFLSGEASSPSALIRRTGQPLEIDGQEKASIRDPSGTSLTLSRIGTKFAARDVVHQGIYDVEQPPETPSLGVSLLSDRGVLPPERESFNSADLMAEKDLPRAARSEVMWVWLAGAASAIAGLDWLLFHRGILRVA
jgi:hypothetical protein